MSFVTENITPDKAQLYLETSKGNRPISMPRVRTYAEMMKRGKWLLNGIPIVFDVDGSLIDGHHRLNAVIMAGIPVRMDVRRGVATDAFLTYDCGRNRTFGQILAINGVKNYNHVGGVVMCNETLKNYGRIWANNNVLPNSQTRQNMDNYELYMEDPEGFKFATYEGLKINTVRLLKPSWVGGLLYYLTHTGGYDMDYVVKFFECACSLSDGSINSANVLRKRLLQDRLANAKMQASYTFALIVKAWNAYVTGKSIQRLAFKSDGEEYPKLILKK